MQHLLKHTEFSKNFKQFSLEVWLLERSTGIQRLFKKQYKDEVMLKFPSNYFPGKTPHTAHCQILTDVKLIPLMEFVISWNG